MSGALARRAVLGLVALALLLRVGAVLATPGYVPHHDDRDYDRLACAVARQGHPPTRLPPFPPAATCALAHERDGLLTAYRPPLWPLTLGAVYAVARHLPVSRWTAGRLLQALIGTAVVALTGAIAAEVWGWPTGLAALGLAALFLPLVLDGATLISEPAFVLLELAAVLAALRHGRRPEALGWPPAAGVLVGLAALTRTSGALLALPLLAAVWGHRRRSARSLLAPAVLAAAAILVVAPWTVRNALVLHAFVPVSTETGATLLGTYNSAARASRCRGCWTLLGRKRRFRGLVARLRRLDEVQRDRIARSLAIRFARRHPGYVAQVAWENSLRLLELGGADRTRFTAATIDVSPRAAVAGAWELWTVAVLAALGAARGALRRAPAWLLALAVLSWVTTVLVQSETPRFRAPLDPFVLMLAAACVRPARADARSGHSPP